MMHERKISVVVPVYKVEQYISECIESILNQTYKNIELILVDDGSPDNCPAICEEYANKDSRVKVLHKQNGGQASARNLGIDNATGELLFFVDSDDYINKYCFETLVNEMEKSGADIVECHSIKFTDGENYDWREKCIEGEKKELTTIEWLTETSLGDFYTYVVWNKLYKTELYKNIKFPVNRVYEDEATLHKVIYKANKVFRVYSRLYYYRYRADSTMTSNMTLKKINDRVLAFRERVEFFETTKHSDVEMFSRAKLCLAIMSIFKESKRLDSTGETTNKLLLEIRKNYKIIKGNKNVPLKYRAVIKLFLLVNRGL